MINYREESEKLNVWIAYLNLENVYGNPPKVRLTSENLVHLLPVVEFPLAVTYFSLSVN